MKGISESAKVWTIDPQRLSEITRQQFEEALNKISDSLIKFAPGTKTRAVKAVLEGIDKTKLERLRNQDPLVFVGTLKAIFMQKDIGVENINADSVDPDVMDTLVYQQRKRLIADCSSDTGLKKTRIE